MNKMTIEEAQLALASHASLVTSERKKIEDCFGLILAEDIVAALTQPPFRRSAMDGYAMHVEDVESASREKPVKLPVVAQIYAGDHPYGSLEKGCAVRIMTGAPIPDGADLVVPQEASDYGEKEVLIYKVGKKEDNCCPIGEDFMKGEILAKKGDRVDAYAIASAVAGGVNDALVYRKLKVSIVTTGSEVVPPGSVLEPGKIYNSNKAYFSARVKELGCELTYVSEAADEVDEIAQKVQEGLAVSDIVLTTGGVSVGKKDYLPTVLDQIGADVLFKGLKIKPGMPTTAGKVSEKMVLCLSGNPYSAIAMFEVLFPFYQKSALGSNHSGLIKMKTITTNGYGRKSPNRRLVRGILSDEGIYIPPHQRNGQLAAGVGSNCLVDIPAGSDAIEAGSEVTFYLLKR